jgi:single-stranded-DNA-specific exonuclease
MDWKLKPTDEKTFKALCDEGVYEVFARIVSNRPINVTNKADIAAFLKSPLEDLEPADVLADMTKACKTIADASGGGKALIYGDYDVDGIMAGYITMQLLIDAGFSKVNTFLPHREKDGYGLNNSSVKNLMAKHSGPYDLIMVVDCGSSSFEQIEVLRKNYDNAPVIVVDHHIIDEENKSSNAAALINPRITDCTPYCTAGLMYQIARKLSEFKDIDPTKYLPYAAMATITDVCDMVGGNRIIVKNGLEALTKCKDVGVRSLFKVADLPQTEYDAADIGFKIGPMLNASGRLEVAEAALKLLVEPNAEKAVDIALELRVLNEKRKDIQNKIFEEAIEKVEKAPKRSSILIHDPNWHAGVVGIVASKLVEKYGVPTLCFGESKGKIKGSARSLEKIHVKNVMDACAHLFDAHGGHEMAAGATLKNSVVDRAWEDFDKCVVAYKKEHNIGLPSIYYDVEIDKQFASKLNQDMSNRIMKLGPFGNCNLNPIFRLKGIMCTGVKAWKSGKGGFVNLEGVKIPCYAFSDKVSKMDGKDLDILFTIQRNFMDRAEWSLKIEHAKLNQ